ncbi:signal peptidase I [Nocardioides sp. C4-1]|uniref:signal peptidase I n=1 Tax=Nocardioides sp. C4-1 TaxID=3151851 RepID=UPI003265B88F
MPHRQLQRAEPRHVLRLLGRWAGRVALLAVVAAVVVVIGVLFVLPRAMQGSALTVLTGSMTPDIPVGSVVLIRPVDPGTLEVGDVATYQVTPEKDAYVTHRVVRIDRSTTPASFIFKGDANRGEDTEPVPAAAIRGEVVLHVPYLGTARDAVQGRGGIAGLVVLVLGAYAVSQVAGAVRDRRRRDHDAPPHVEGGLVLVELPPGTTADEVEAVVARLVYEGRPGALVGPAVLLLAAPTDEADVHELLELLELLDRRVPGTTATRVRGPVTLSGESWGPLVAAGRASRATS